MEKHVLILATTNDFLLKFEQDNVALLQAMGYTVHYAANLREPAYLSDRERIRARGVVPHHIDIARSPYLLGDNRRALRQVLCLLRRWEMGAIHCHTPVGGLVGGWRGGWRPPGRWWCTPPTGSTFTGGRPCTTSWPFTRWSGTWPGIRTF